MRRSLMLLAAAATTVAGSAMASRDTPEVAFNKLLAGKTAGPPQTCIDTQRGRSSSLSASGNRLAYRFGRDLVYVTETAGGCEGIARGDILVNRIYQGVRACRGDIVTTLDRVTRFPTGGCSFGDFVPYRTAQ